ncbi:MAG: hypothetical protein ABI651_08795 [Verrucomicrobiota bacterium]
MAGQHRSECHRKCVVLTIIHLDDGNNEINGECNVLLLYQRKRDPRGGSIISPLRGGVGKSAFQL